MIHSVHTYYLLKARPMSCTRGRTWEWWAGIKYTVALSSWGSQSGQGNRLLINNININSRLSES